MTDVFDLEKEAENVTQDSLANIKEDFLSEEIAKATYVFNSDSVAKEKCFAFDEYEGGCAYGVFLPKNVEREKPDMEGNTKFQVWEPVLINNNRILLSVRRPNFEFDRKIKFGSIPEHPEFTKQRWSLESIKLFLDGKLKVKDKDINVLLERIVNYYRKYCYFPNSNWYYIHSLWDVGTYIYNLFDKYPIFELWGHKGTGKTQSMIASSFLGFNSSEPQANPTESIIFRITDVFRGVRYVDEAEMLFFDVKGKYNPSPIAQLLNAGHRKNASSVYRNELYGKRYKPTRYNAYAPSMLASINGLRGATRDRSIVRISTKDPKGNIYQEPMFTKEVREIRDLIYVFVLDNYEIIKEEIVSFRKVEGLKDRDYDLWKPILVLAKIMCPDMYESIFSYAIQLTNNKLDANFDKGSWEYTALSVMHEMLVINSNSEKIHLKNILLNWKGEEQHKPHPKTLSATLDKLGLQDYRSKDNEGSYYKNLTIEVLENICASVGVDYSSFSSFSSRDRRETTLNEVTKGDEEEKIVTKKSDEYDEYDELTNGYSIGDLNKQLVIKHILEHNKQYKQPMPKSELLAKLRCDWNTLKPLIESLKEKADIYELKPELYEVLE